MSKQLIRGIRQLLLAVGSLTLVSGNVLAQSVPTNEIDQTMINVSDLRDVAPTDWAYEALANLVERYGCIAGYPDQTFRGDKPLSRYEFAAGLNACLQQIESLIAASEAITQEDLAVMAKLSSEFEAELAVISSRVDSLEGRVAFLEEHQFSTTTKLQGEVIGVISQVFGKELEFRLR